MPLRCSKCGSHAGFLIETSANQTLEVKGKLPLRRILKAVLVTCMYCNARWNHVPLDLVDPSLAEARSRGETKLVPKAVLRQ